MLQARSYIGIIGSRRRNSHADYMVVLSKFNGIYQRGDWIVSGGCPEGGDAFAEEIAKANGIPIIIFPADWELHGKAAGFIRNQDIADWSNQLIACVHSDRTGGTEDTIKKFLIRGQHQIDNLYLV